MRTKLPFFLLIFISFPLLSQVTKDKDFAVKSDSVLGWHNGGMLMLTLSQASFTNWSAGGENLVSYNGLFNYFSRYNDGKISWDNNIDLALGMVHQGSLDRKSDDKIDLTSKLGRAITEHWYYAGLLNFKTQFLEGFNYPNDSVRISNFLAPAYLVAALGFDYKPKTYLSIFLAPVASRLTIVNDQALADTGAFGVDPGKKSRFEFGNYIRLAFQNDIMTNVNLTAKVETFSNYLDKPQNIAINGELILTMKVNKYIGATVATQIIYDDAVKYKDEGPKVQFREVIGVGFSYQF